MLERAARLPAGRRRDRQLARLGALPPRRRGARTAVGRARRRGRTRQCRDRRASRRPLLDQPGRRFEARYAWTAARQMAEGDDVPRLAGKIANGL
ncbi:hypothetical protein AB5I41_13550 [Sphingomonas sp. MMS24-JH45]